MNICHDGRFLAAPLGSRAFEEAAPHRGGPPCGSDEWNGSPLGIPVPWGWVVSSSTPCPSVRSGLHGNARVDERLGKESDQGGHHGPDESKRIATAGIFEFPLK